MSPFSIEERSSMQQILLKEIREFSYRHQRYQIDYSLSIGYSPEPVELNSLSAFIRESDHFIELKPNICAVILDCANDDNGVKAANNLLSRFQGNFFSTPLYASIVTARDFETPLLMVNDLFYLLDYAITHNMNNMLMDSSRVMQKL